jgi:hypothetical protein
MKKIFLILFILSSISSSSQEKRNCGTNERLDLYRQSHPESIKKSQVLEQHIQKWIDANEIKLFPIPTKGIFYVNYSQYSKNISNYAEIFNSLGQLVLKKKLNKTTKFDLIHQKNGLYYLNITTKKTRVIKKLIIQN